MPTAHADCPRPPRVGLVGLGDAGAHHAQALLELMRLGRAELTAVCGRDAGRLTQRRQELGLPESVEQFTSLPALLASRCCDAVILATPDGSHADQIAQCAAAGLHILVEKPLALSVADAQQAVSAARASSVLLHVGYHLRYHAAHQLVQAQLPELIGPLRSLSLRWAWPDPATEGWRARGESARFWSLAALGTHAIDLCQWLARSPIIDSVGLTVPDLTSSVDRSADVSLLFASGVLAHVAVSVTHRALSRCLLVGDRGEIECLGTFGARGGGEVWFRPLRQAAQQIPFSPQDPYLVQLANFVAALASKKELGATLTTETTDESPLGDAMANVVVLESLAAPQCDVQSKE